MALTLILGGGLHTRDSKRHLGQKLQTLHLAIKVLISLVAACFVLGLSATPALADNLLTNPGFELTPPPNDGNNIGHSVMPWILGPGNSSNVVKVDGPGGFDYGNRGPESDAAAPGAGIDQHYLDIANGSNDFFQPFTVPACSTAALVEHEASGSFSARDGQTAMGSIRILNGTGLNGTVVTPEAGASLSVTTNDNVNWTDASGFYQLIPGNNYTYVVSLNNPANFDEANLTSGTFVCPVITISATDDSYNAPVEATGAIGFMNVLSDNGGGVDTLDGTPATDTTVTITAVGTLPAGVTLNTDGSVDVAGASEGIISFDYQICQVGDPTNCDIATVIFTVLDMSGTGLAANPQLCVSPLATYSGGASGTLSAGTHSANYSASITASSGFNGSSFSVGSGDSLIGSLTSNTSVNPDSYTVTYALSAVTSPSHVIRLYGGRGLPGGGTGGDNQAAEITLSWTGGTGNATYYDPVTPSSAIYRFLPDADFDINQREIFGAETTGGIANGGKFRVYNVFNANREWYVDFPKDATSVTITRDVIFNQNSTAEQGNDSLLPLLGRSPPGSGESFNEWVTFSTLLCEGEAVLSAEKQVSIWDPLNEGLYAIPGNDVIYTLSGANTGTGPTDAGSILMIDILPPNIEFFNGDVDDDGAEVNPVSFSQSSGAGLIFNYANDIGFWNGPTKPADFAGCSYIPTSGYDPNVTYICFNPKGELVANDPNPTFEFKFRARIE